MVHLLWLTLLAPSVFSYTPDWKSLDSRPLPSWYETDKFGIFVHWGVFSVPAFGSEWFWWYLRGEKQERYIKFMNENYPGYSYGDFGKLFTASDFDGDSFAEIVEASGARYFVVTTKHHEGFTLWPSSTSFNWNSVDIGPHRDLVAEFQKAIRAKGIHFGVYFSQFDWFHPLYLNDKANITRDYPQQVSLVQMRELVEQYKPDVIWSDGAWERSDDYWKAKEFLAWLFTDSPVKEKVVVNDRWGRGIDGRHGSFKNVADGWLPGHLVSFKWESCMTLDKQSWGYRRNIKSGDVRTVKELVATFAKVLAWNGNLLLNIGPDHLGNIPAIFEDRLRQLGKFVKTNEEAIFETKPWIHQNDSEYIWYTSKLSNHFEVDTVYNPQIEGVTVVYAFILQWDSDYVVTLKSIKPTDNTKVTLLGTTLELKYQMKPAGFTVILPSGGKFPCPEAIVLKIENAASSKHRPKVRHSFKGASPSGPAAPVQHAP